jgi:hypothetical protein
MVVADIQSLQELSLRDFIAAEAILLGDGPSTVFGDGA